MQKNLIVSAALALCTTAVAQTTYFTSPSGLDSTEGGYYSSRHGVYPDMRIQNCDGTMGKTVTAVKSLTMRWDRSVAAWTQYARSFKNVMLKVSEGDIATFGQTFSANVKSTPRMVFSGSMSWAGGKVVTNQSTPYAWRTDAHFPFSTPYLHLGTADVLYDFHYAGGSLANGVTWASSSYRGYFFDSFTSSRSFGYSSYTNVGNAYNSGNACIDSGRTGTLGAYVRPYSYNYGPNYSTSSYRNKMRVFNYGSYFGPSANVMLAVGIGMPNMSGVTMPGVSCQKIHVDLTKPLFLFPQKASTSGSLSYNGLFGGASPSLFNAIPAAVGKVVTVQGAWDDTKSKALQLSAAGYITIMPIPKVELRRAAYHYNATSATATNRGGSLSTGFAYYSPLFRVGK